MPLAAVVMLIVPLRPHVGGGNGLMPDGGTDRGCTCAFAGDDPRVADVDDLGAGDGESSIGITSFGATFECASIRLAHDRHSAHAGGS
jgi:hypothetical protein